MYKGGLIKRNQRVWASFRALHGTEMDEEGKHSRLPSACPGLQFRRAAGRRGWRTESALPAGSTETVMAAGPPSDCLRQPIFDGGGFLREWFPTKYNHKILLFVSLEDPSLPVVDVRVLSANTRDSSRPKS